MQQRQSINEGLMMANGAQDKAGGQSQVNQSINGN